VSNVTGQFSTQFAKSYTRVQTLFFTLGTAEFNAAQEIEKEIISFCICAIVLYVITCVVFAL
jgi:hypothetical protein